MHMLSLVKLRFSSLCQICVNACINSYVVCLCQYVGGKLRLGFVVICLYNMCYYMCLDVYASPRLCLFMSMRVCRAVGVVRLCSASVSHISRGVLSAGPSGGPLRFMECHSVAAAVNQVNVADPISSVVLRSRWKNNI